MSTTELINSGDLELYVYGILNDSDTKHISDLSKTDAVLKKEIVSIEHNMLALSSSFSPIISSDVFEKIKNKLELKDREVIKMQPNTKWSNYLGWAASVVLLIGVGFQYARLNEHKAEIEAIQKEKIKLNETVTAIECNNQKTEAALNVIRDTKNTVVALAGQAVSATSYAKIYWNKQTQVVYVDAAGLPEPPKGKVYQIWSLKLVPQLTPTSIGLLTDFTGNKEKLFEVSKTNDAQAFGITLEPAGGSKSPTMEQLYTLGKV
ncbi:MAG: anti-sigma factor [Flavobacterium sp. BFFFF2]|nr:MAG: anti-sigma factor [Flavobacterium sp. BFFFF2]